MSESDAHPVRDGLEVRGVPPVLGIRSRGS